MNDLELLKDKNILCPKIYSFDKVRELIQENREEIKDDLLKIADSYECEELRLAVEGYFSAMK